MKTIILHIGAGKTGSSSIQTSLDHNRSILQEEGFIVPSTDLQKETQSFGQQVWYFANFKKMDIENASSKLRDDIQRNFEEHDSNMHSIILSAENLSDDHGWYKLFKGLKETYKIRIIFYIRRQDTYLISAWQQWYSKINGDFWAWITRVGGALGNWRHMIELWSPLVENENFDVRLFERESLINGNVVKDFYHVLGVDLKLYSEDAFKINSNSSYNHGVLDFVEKNQNLFSNPHDNQFYEFIDNTTQSSRKISKHSRITHLQRLSILQKYYESNKWILDEYLPESNRNSLFIMPKIGDYIYVDEKDVEEQKMNIIIESLFSLYKMNNK